MKQSETFNDIYLLVVKPDTVWTESMDVGYSYSLIPMTSTLHNAIIMDLKEEHNVKELTKFSVFNIPRRFKEFNIKNASKSHTSYLILKKGK